MRTAEESRKLSEENLKKILDKDLEEISKKIDSAIRDGSFCISYYDNISKEAQNRLIELGYNITDYSSQREGICYSISWES